MPLALGTRIGHFEVRAPLGAGGMGEVYRVHDERLGREVALKVLPADVATDPDRLARFEREARATAALNHPNILVVFEVGTEGTAPFVVSELLEGETLREALHHRLTMRKAIDYASQIGSGLAAAHEKGVVHRDLKPENLFVTTDGRIKILDFGLAKLVTPASVEAKTSAETLSATAPGTVLGTAGYMAPEQVRGEKVDHRADIFSFGAVLYEMLTGRRAFRGETSAETLAAILKDDPPDLSQVAPLVPPGVALVLRRCLEKRPADRFQSARDIGFALEAGAEFAGAAGRAPRALSRWAILASAAALTGLLLGLFLSRSGKAPAAAPRRLAIETSASAPLSSDIYVPFALSPDGATLAYVTYQPERLFLRRLDAFEPTPLPGAEGAADPFFSPDGEWVGFWTNGKIKKIPVAGGPAVTICDAEDMLGASWGDDGTIVFSANAGTPLSAVSAMGGAPRSLTTLDSARHEVQHAFPQVLPGGRAVLFTAATHSNDSPFSVEVQDLASGERRTLVPGARYGRYLPPGYLVYVRGGTVFAAPIDIAKLRIEGPAVAVQENVASGLAREALLSIAGDGTLAFVQEYGMASRTLVWVDRRGAVAALGVPPRPYRYPRLSPDGRRIAVSVPEPGRQDIWIYRIETETLERLTFDRAATLGFYHHVFSPDGTRLAYAVDAAGGFQLVSQPADASGPAQVLLTWARRVAPQGWLRDAQTMILNELGSTGRGDLLVLHLGAEPKVTPVLQEPGNQWGGFPSPDGRYLAYSGDESGRFEIYLVPFPGPGPKRQLTTEGGEEPVWSRDGRELFYRTGERLMVIPLSTASPLQAGRPRLLFEGRFVSGSPGLPAYDVAPDGRRLLMMKGEDGERPRMVRIVLNWRDEVRRRLNH